MKRLSFLVILAVLTGCLGSQHAASPTQQLARYRELAQHRPHDPLVRERLLEAEMFDPEGDPEAAARLSAAVMEEPTGRLRALVLSALQAESHGHPEASLQALLRALEQAPQSREPLAAPLAEFVVHAIAGLDGAVPGYDARVAAALDAHMDGLPAPARHVALEMRMRLAQKHGQVEHLPALAAQAGCVREAVATEPFGTRPLLSFDSDFGVDPAQPLKAAYDLGPGRGVQPVRTVKAHGCALHLGGGPLVDGGTRFVQFPIDNTQAGQVLLRVDTPNTIEVFLDGESVLRVDRREAIEPRITYVPLTLAEGEHRVTLKVTSRHPSPVLSFAITPLRGIDLSALHPRRPVIYPFERFLQAALQVAGGDLVAARETLVSVTEGDSPFLLMQRAEVALADPLSPSQVAADDSRAWLQRAYDKDQGLWSPAVRIAALAEENGRTQEAIDFLRELKERFPDVPAIGMRLSSALSSKGWDEAAEAEVRRLRRLVPDACGPMHAELDMLLSRGRYGQARPLVDEIMRCDATSNAHYSQLLRERRWDDAGAELRRLERFSSEQLRYGYLVSGLELAREKRDEATAHALLAELRSRFPRSENAVLETVDHLLEAGKPAAALKELQVALMADPGEMVGLHRLRPVLGGEYALADYRVDGLARIKAFEASGRSYEGPQVLVFDYMAVRVFEDGSSLELVHTIQRPQTDEAVDSLAEVSVPGDARVLTLRVVKQDGSILEPDAISGKDTISLPGMSQGDYVELEFVRPLLPPDGFPGGYLGDRFYFGSYEVPFDHSELVVVSDADMPLQNDARGDAPKAQVSRRGDLIEQRFIVDQSAALTPEPASVSPREFVPSVRLGHKATWASLVASIREMLVDRDMRDPELRQLAQAVAGEGDVPTRAQRLYDFVLDTVENDDDLFSQAAVMFRGRSGNRARVLHYLLQLAEVPSQLVLARSAAADQTASTMADTDTYEHLLVRVGTGDDSFLLFTPETHATFGYVPSLLRGQPALVLAPDAPSTMVAPAEIGDELRLIDATVQLSADGAAKLSIVERVRGAGAASWRRELESVPQVELERRFEQEYVVRLLPGAQLTSLQIEGRTREAEDFVLRYEVSMDVLSRRTEKGWAMPALFSSELAANYARIPSRTTTMFTGAMVETDIRLHVRFPQGAQLPPPPASFAVEADKAQAQFTQHAVYDGAMLNLRRTLRIPPQRIGPSSYAEFVDFCRTVDAAEDRELVYAPGQ